MDASVRINGKHLLHTFFFYRLYSIVYRNSEVFVEMWQEKVIIVGIDDYGFLKVRKLSDGNTVTLHADVHSFDVRQGIIHEKAM